MKTCSCGRYLSTAGKSALEAMKKASFRKFLFSVFPVVYAYEQSLLCLGYYPDMWYEAALFLQQAGKQLEEKGDVKLAQQMTAEAMRELPLFFKQSNSS